MAPFLLFVFFIVVLWSINIFNSFTNIKTSINISPTPSSQPYPTYNPPPTPTSIPHVQLDLGPVNWFQYPKSLKLSLLSPVSNDTTEYSDYDIDNAKYLQTGSFSDGSKLINIIIESQGMGAQWELHRLISTSDQKFYLFDSALAGYFAQPVYLVETTIPGLESPPIIKTSKLTLEQSSPSFWRDNYLSFTEIKTPKFFEKTPYGSIYVVYSNSEPSIYNRDFYLRHRDDTVSYYNLKFDFFTDDRILQFKYLDGSSNQATYEGGVRGTGNCGGVIGSVIPSSQMTSSSLTKVGTLVNTTYAHQDIYKINDINHPVLKMIYQGYQIGRPLDNQPNVIDSITKFTDYPTHFLWQDDIDDWHLFLNSEYGSLTECAKPVIYLYPTQDTIVNVKVGADMSQSDPLYPSNGWTVLAGPSGNLTYQNQSYPYLFWEGMGKGIYPDYRNRGTIVTQFNLISTLKSQLSALGLNAKESADFMEFWQSKLPTTPYVRLTWLDTVDMNRLAPLAVNPRPDTVTRIFLEFEGLQQPRPLIPQTLSSVPRRGFTLIEWGGLLIGKRP